MERDDADELLAVRRGERSLDSLIEEAEELDAKLDILYESSTLPKSPPVNKLNALCMTITEDFLAS